MIVKLAFNVEEVGNFFKTVAGKRVAIGAGIGAVAGGISKDDNRTLGVMRGAAIGGAAGFIGHHTGAIDYVKNKGTELLNRKAGA